VRGGREKENRAKNSLPLYLNADEGGGVESFCPFQGRREKKRKKKEKRESVGAIWFGCFHQKGRNSRVRGLITAARTFRNLLAQTGKGESKKARPRSTGWFTRNTSTGESPFTAKYDKKRRGGDMTEESRTGIQVPKREREIATRGVQLSYANRK